MTLLLAQGEYGIKIIAVEFGEEILDVLSAKFFLLSNDAGCVGDLDTFGCRRCVGIVDEDMRCPGDRERASYLRCGTTRALGPGAGFPLAELGR